MLHIVILPGSVFIDAAHSRLQSVSANCEVSSSFAVAAATRATIRRDAGSLQHRRPRRSSTPSSVITVVMRVSAHRMRLERWRNFDEFDQHDELLGLVDQLLLGLDQQRVALHQAERRRGPARP